MLTKNNISQIEYSVFRVGNKVIYIKKTEKMFPIRLKKYNGNLQTQ